MIYLSIIIPYYNEKEIIVNNIDTIKHFFNDNITYEIILIDDTGNFQLNKYFNINNKNFVIINNQRNKGKGFSLREAIKIAKGQLCLLTDADLSAPISEFNKLHEEYLNEFPIVIGSRSLSLATQINKQKLLRKTTGKIFNLLTRYILGLHFKDTQCGFKLFKTSILKKIIKDSHVNGFCIDPEILYIAKKNNIRIKEVGIKWKYNKNSSVRLTKDTALMLFDLLKIRIRN